MIKDAVISPCGQYRYRLRRIWDETVPLLVFVMLNPSTADADKDDATIRKCIGFAKRYEYGGIVVVNLFALRSRHPGLLRQHYDPIGFENDGWIDAETTWNSGTVVVAWGSHGVHFPERVARVVQIIRTHQQPHCLSKLNSGQPGHPLMLPYNLHLRVWTSPDADVVTFK